VTFHINGGFLHKTAGIILIPQFFNNKLFLYKNSSIEVVCLLSVMKYECTHGPRHIQESGGFMTTVAHSSVGFWSDADRFQDQKIAAQPESLYLMFQTIMQEIAVFDGDMDPCDRSITFASSISIDTQ
jgi:hypothetical protein